MRAIYWICFYLSMLWGTGSELLVFSISEVVYNYRSINQLNLDGEIKKDEKEKNKKRTKNEGP